MPMRRCLARVMSDERLCERVVVEDCISVIPTSSCERLKARV